jgi:protein SCO1/2
MSKFIKAVFLIVTLLVPAGIFTFLKYFGNNKFDVEVMYEAGVPDKYKTECNINLVPYSISEFVLDKKAGLKLAAFDNGSDELEFKNISIRLSELFKDDLNIRLLAKGDKQSPYFKTLTVTAENYEKYIGCNFILEDLNQLVLLDEKNRIRGYYGRDLDEIDRLIVEVKILLENGVDGE